MSYQAAGLVTRGEAERAGGASLAFVFGKVGARAAACEWAAGGAFATVQVERQAAAVGVEAERARAAGLLSAAAVAGIRAEEREAARAAKRGGFLSAWQVGMMRAAARHEFEAERAAAEQAAAGLELARIRKVKREQAAAAAAAASEVVERGGVLIPAGSLGAGKDGAERAEVERARRILEPAAARPEWSAEVAAEQARAAGWRAGLRPSGLMSAVEWASLTVERFRAAQVRARAAGLFRAGLSGRAAARAARIGAAKARRWLRQNSRREALSIFEVGAAAGVDDLGAGITWGQELVGISVAVHQAAAAAAVEVLGHAAAVRAAGGRRAVGGHLPAACAAILRRVHALGSIRPQAARAAMLGRGIRSTGKPLVEWTAAGRVVALESFGMRGRGRAWRFASMAAGRALHAARYGAGGRDGREVAAEWSANGTVSGAVSIWWDRLPDGAAFEAGRRQATRRPQVVANLRASLALALWGARAEVERARRAGGMQGLCPAERMAAGSRLGAARRALSAMVERTAIIGRALRGDSLADCSAWVETTTRGNHRLTAAGRKSCQRFRDDFKRREECAFLWEAAAAVEVVNVSRATPGDEITIPRNGARHIKKLCKQAVAIR